MNLSKFIIKIALQYMNKNKFASSAKRWKSKAMSNNLVFVCVLCVVVCVYLSLRYLTLVISTDEILRMTAQFFISLCQLFWAAMCSSLYLFILFCKFRSILSTNKVVVVHEQNMSQKRRPANLKTIKTKTPSEFLLENQSQQ